MKSFKLVLLNIISFVLSIAPLLMYFAFNYDRYVGTRVQGLKLLFGGTLLVFILVLKALKRLKMPSGVWFFTIMFMLAYFLETVLIDLKMLSLLALVGEVLDMIMQSVIQRVRVKQEALNTASTIEKAIENSISGRV